jgi:hypothetical protein
MRFPILINSKGKICDSEKLRRAHRIQEMREIIRLKELKYINQTMWLHMVRLADVSSDND